MNNSKRNFIKNSMITAAGFSLIPGLNLGKEGGIVRINSFGKPKVALLTNIYRAGSHADMIGTKLFLGIPTDEGMISPSVDIASVWIDQIGPTDIGTRIAKMNGAEIYPTIADALRLGGDKLAVDAVIYIGEHGEYSRSRFGIKMYPRMNHLEQVFRIFDASGRSVPVFTDKHLAYSWLDSKWIYDRAKELNVPMMAGSSLPYCWRDPMLEHPIGTKISEAVAVGYGSNIMDSYGFHVLEMMQCMVERRSKGETGVSNVQGLEGDAVWKAIDAEEISMELVEAACDKIKKKAIGSMRKLVKNPKALLIQYNDGMKGSILMLDQYINESWAYAAKVGNTIEATEFVLSPGPISAHFSYIALNIQKFIVSGGKAPVPIERNLLTSGILDIGIRSMKTSGNVIPTPFLNMQYTIDEDIAIRPKSTRPIGESIGTWRPKYK